MLLSMAMGTVLASKEIRCQVGRGMRIITAVIVAAMVINILNPLQASATSSGTRPRGVVKWITFPS